MGRFCLLITFFSTARLLGSTINHTKKKWKTNSNVTWDTSHGILKSAQICTSKNHQRKKNLVFMSNLVSAAGWLATTTAVWKVLVVCNFNECLMVDMSEFISFHFVWDWVRGPPPSLDWKLVIWSCLLGDFRMWNYFSILILKYPKDNN